MSESVEPPVSAPLSPPALTPREAGSRSRVSETPAIVGGTGMPGSAEEVDVWWGSYSGWTMMPSMVLCVVLTGLIGWWVLIAIPRGSMQLVFLGLVSVVWLVQGVRWGWHFFGISYRLTSRRLFRDRGFLRPDRVQVRLDTIRDVRVKRSAWERLMHVGRIEIDAGGDSPVILAGVLHPKPVAALIHEWSQIVRDMKPDSPPGDSAANGPA